MAQQRAANRSKAIYNRGQPHGTVKVLVVGARHDDIVLF
jgi:hypothetical protein